MSRWVRFTAVMLSIVLSCTWLTAQSSAPSATVALNLQKPIGKVSPTLYGLMTEEINHSYDGGLYAELIANRALMDSDWMPDHWTLRQNAAAGASMVFDKQDGPSAALTRSLKLTVTRASNADPTGIQNDGYWGIPVLADTTYAASFYAKAGAATIGVVTVSLIEDDNGKVLASATSEPLTTHWKQYRLTLHTNSGAPNTQNHVAFTVGAAGTVWFSQLSLFPPTYKGTLNGNRIDLMEKLAAMKPHFLRFPGGNYLEGDRINERFDWKKTIGPLVDRPGHRSPWNYHSTDGMGLLEFLEWCEDLNMEPVLAVYAGYSLGGEHVDAGPALQPYVQDALDEIQYVTGGTGTKWGAERARDGHSTPFRLRYVEIGNEDNFDRSHSYDARFAQFYDAIKRVYPSLQLIATTQIQSRTPDLYDDHYYREQEGFYTDTHHYDHASRTGPKIFVGEWATLEATPTPDFGAALSDAAWLTGLERNSDLVLMASYAPLLVNVSPGAMQWRTNLIGYDAATSYGSPSYYMQATFANNIGTDILNCAPANANPRFYCSATADPAQHMLYLKLVNASPLAQPVEVAFDGARVQPQGTLISLHAPTKEATNTITDPKHIAPMTTTLNGIAAQFHHEVPGYSIEVLKIGYE